ncbi:hypothetical protein I4U23_012470 [Adineta vaga]|nr:hypothetical protein I4U23_012470 [Adineta vaga]
MGNSIGAIDPQLMNDIQEHAKIVATKIPLNYIKERKDILNKMKSVSPKPYKNLLYSEYPEKNRAKVNTLALHYATSDTSKKNLSLEVNKQIQPKVEQELVGKNSLVQKGIKKAVEIAVEQAISRAIDAVVKNIDINDPNTE